MLSKYKKHLAVGLLSAAALTSPVYFAYHWFTANYVVLSREDAMQMFMLLMACMGGMPK